MGSGFVPATLWVLRGSLRHVGLFGVWVLRDFVLVFGTPSGLALFHEGFFGTLRVGVLRTWGSSDLGLFRVFFHVGSSGPLQCLLFTIFKMRSVPMPQMCNYESQNAKADARRQ